MRFLQKVVSGICLGSLGLLLVPADAQVQRMRATLKGGSEGKCTFEVVVDGVAEVEIHGDTGVLRTLQGNPATWRRLECSQPLPNNPGDFRFKGIDGRGTQSLARDPRYTGGIAVVRLEDPRGGSEGYTGDILWKGGDSHWGGGGNWGSGGAGWEDPWQSGNATNSGFNYKDAVAVCRAQVARVRNIPANSVAVQRNGGEGLSPRGFELRFNATGNRGQDIAGQCTVTRSGQLLNFNINGGSWNDRVSHNQAMTTCEEEVSRRMMVSGNNLRLQSAMDSGSGNYNFNWQARRANGAISTGICSVTPSGKIAEFGKR